MHLAGLQTFLTVVQSGNLNRAADQLNVSQSTVTARLDALEEALGQQLLLRSRKGAVLTKAGFAFQRHAESMVQSWELAKRTVGLSKEFAGLYAVACEADLWDGLCSLWVAEIRRRRPDLALEAWPGTIDEARRWLTSGLVDAALLREPVAGRGFASELVARDPIVQVASSARRSQDGFSDYVYVDHGPEFRRWHAQAWPGDHVPKLSFGASGWALPHLLQAGGAAYLPLRMVQAHLESGRLFAVEAAPTFGQAIHLSRREASVHAQPWLGDDAGPDC